MPETDFIICRAVCRKNGKAYIEQIIYGLDARHKEHIAKAKRRQRFSFYSALRKYSADSFDWEVLCRASSLSELNELEAAHIALHGTISPNGYNADSGGKSAIPSAESRAKITDTLRGENNPNFGKTPSAEQRAKIAEAQKARRQRKRRRLIPPFFVVRCGSCSRPFLSAERLFLFY